MGVSMVEDWKPVKAYIEEKKVSYPIVIGNEGQGRLYGLNSMPIGETHLPCDVHVAANG